MVTDACRDWRNEIAATAAGRPDPVRATGLAAHLEGCPHCREELAELTPVAQALHLVDPDRLADPPAPPEGLGRSVVSAVAAVRRSEARGGAVAPGGNRGGGSSGSRGRRRRSPCALDADGGPRHLRRVHHRAGRRRRERRAHRGRVGHADRARCRRPRHRDRRRVLAVAERVRRRSRRGGHIPRGRTHADVGRTSPRRRPACLGDR